MASNRTLVDGLRIAWRLDGPERAPPVMLSNSLASDMTMWDAQIEALAGRYRVLRYDRRGHGGSETAAPPYSIERLAADALALLESLDIERVHFVGLSLGGMIGQHLGANHPERLLSLTLCDTAPHMPPPSMWDERIETARTEGMAGLAQATLERWFTPAFHRANAAGIARVRSMILGTSVDGFTGCCMAIRDMDQRADLRRITVPTLIVVGEHDPSTPVAASEFLHDAIRGSELAVIEDAAHLSNIEQPAAFNAALLPFLARC